MRFSLAWANVLKENISLRAAVACLSATTLALGIVAVRLAVKKPILIERGCVTEAVKQGDSSRNEAEIKTFLHSALPSRFDTSTADARTYLSDQEFHNRIAEQEDFERKNIKQRVLVNEIEMKDGEIQAALDRVISVGEIRSVLSFPVRVSVSTVERSQTNPYGLVVSNVSLIKQKEDK